MRTLAVFTTAYAISNCQQPEWRNDVEQLLGKLEGIAVSDEPHDEDKQLLIDYARLAIALLAGDLNTVVDKSDDDIQVSIDGRVDGESQEEHALNVAFNQ
jgi:hypothetical protein